MKKQNLLTITNIIFVNLTAHLEFSSSYRNHYRRGLASIVTTAIMLSSVAVIGATTVSWSQSNLSAREQALGSKDGSIINQIKESLVLEHFWYDTPNQKLNLILKNTGTIGLHVIEIRIDGPTSQDTPITNAGILPDGIYAASVHYTWLGAPIDVFVTTDRGSIFRTHLVSPTDGVLIINKVSKLGNGNFSYNGDLGNFYIATAGWSTGANLDKNGNLIMSGVIRDFNGSADSGDSLIGRDPDFEMICPCPFGLYPGIVLPNLGSDHTPVYNNQTNSPFNHGFVRFNQWYHDTPGVNFAKNLNITLIKNKQSNPTTWTYDNSSFFPIDNQLFCKNVPKCSGLNGTLGQPKVGYHNFGFTFMVHSTFTYQGGETFNFTGDDDVFVFINHKLAIDLGGVHGAAPASINLDAQQAQLGLTQGGTYDFDFFYAERHTVLSDMKITTSIQLGQNGVGATGAFFVDPGKYTINELVPNGWTLIGRQCDNGYTLPGPNQIQFTVPRGVTTCTFTNTKY